jgi:hypothetical protein
MGRARHWVPLAVLGFAELVLVTVELFRRSAATVELGTRLTPVGTRHYEGVFGFSIEGYEQAQWLSLGDTVRAYTGGSGPLWQYTLLAAGLVVVGWYAVTRRFRPRVLVALAVGVLLAVPLLDLLAFSQFGWDAATRGPVLATLGLALVAWAERSPLVLGVAVVAGVAAVAVADLPGALVSAVVLVAGAFAAALRPDPAAA